MTGDLHPSAGVRLLLELTSSDAAGARYRAAILTPDARRDLEVAIAADGAVTIDGSASASSDEHVEALRRIARTIAKDSATATPPWPRRILRWRDK